MFNMSAKKGLAYLEERGHLAAKDGDNKMTPASVARFLHEKVRGRARALCFVGARALSSERARSRRSSFVGLSSVARATVVKAPP